MTNTTMERTAGDEQFLRELEQAECVVVTYKDFVSPRFSFIRLPDIEQDSRKIKVDTFFEHLGLRDAQIQRVYLHDGRGYTGRFRRHGGQALADLLGKEVTLYRQPQSEPFYEKPETFSPCSR